MEGVKRPEVIESKTCSRLRVGFTSSLRRGTRSTESASPVTFSGPSETPVQPDGPFSSLVICVTGLSREARKQVMEATEKLGGEYSPSLNSRCTHLVVESCDGRKFEHALKHQTRDGLCIVTLGWFVGSVRGNVRLCESLYTVRSLRETKTEGVEPNQLVSFGVTDKSCHLVDKTHRRFLEAKSKCKKDLAFSGYSFYIDPDTADEIQDQISEIAVLGGAKLVRKWFVGCNASHVVCEGKFVHRYLGHTDNLVTPRWVLKTVEEKHTKRLVQISADLAQHIRIALENLEKESCREGVPDDASRLIKRTCKDRQKIVESAKNGVRNRRVHRTRPITLSSLLDSICWTISEPTSTASVYTDCCSAEEVGGDHLYALSNRKTNASFTNSTRLLTESEKKKMVYKNHFLTILFPVDQYGEMGPSARTYFSETGFTCVQVLDHIYMFYQEIMSDVETEAAIHTDSRHGEDLRAAYSDRTVLRRIQFLGRRTSFETLKHVSSNNYNNVYELMIRA